MSFKNHIPNTLTCFNLLCGCIGIVLVFSGKTAEASYLIYAAAIFDFFDGFAARMLKANSAIGKDLDSLADMVTFGVLPGMMLMQLFLSVNPGYRFNANLSFLQMALPYAGMIVIIFSAVRLAKFNNDTRQSESFIGMPTPANALLISAFPFIIQSYLIRDIADRNNILENFTYQIFSTPSYYIVFCIVMSYLLVAELPLFALKFKNFSWADNKYAFSLVIISAFLLVWIKIAALPVIIVLYLLLSAVKNGLKFKV